MKNPRYICGYSDICNLIVYYEKQVIAISDKYEEEMFYLQKKLDIIN